MKEASYYSELSDDVVRRVGGKMIKISDRSTLGLPDSMHVVNGIVTYVETKIGEGVQEINGFDYVQPWKFVKKDMRQYEVCRSISKHALVLYAVYYPSERISCVMKISDIEPLRHNPEAWVCNPDFIKFGRGSDQIIQLMEQNKREIMDRYV